MFVHLVPIKLKPGVSRDDPRVAAWHAAVVAIEREFADRIICDYEH
ncbi:MAG TPA: hypothetical protein PLW68_16245 [Casimicrobiaceae bacterium]|nr:hypothetical protein [Casimicrobiaceae bacterium]